MWEKTIDLFGNNSEKAKLQRTVESLNNVIVQLEEQHQKRLNGIEEYIEVVKRAFYSEGQALGVWGSDKCKYSKEASDRVDGVALWPKFNDYFWTEEEINYWKKRNLWHWKDYLENGY
jgi:hypothetical protein